VGEFDRSTTISKLTRSTRASSKTAQEVNSTKRVRRPISPNKHRLHSHVPPFLPPAPLYPPISVKPRLS